MAFKIRRKSRQSEEIPLASTADIAFLLIVFFLAASAILEMRGISIPLPQKDAPPMQILSQNIFRIEIDENGDFFHEGQRIEDVKLQEDIINAYEQNSELVAVVRVQPEAPSAAIPRIARLLQEGGIPRVSIGMER